MNRLFADVERITYQDAGIQILQIAGRDVEAICYTRLCGPCSAGDKVLVNTTASDMGLGTGGYDFVIAKADGASQADGLRDVPPEWDGRMMKLRYTPLQIDVATVEEEGSPFHETMLDATDLGGMPAVCCELHSHVPLVAAGIRSEMPDAKIVYCMTDEGALMAEFSNIVRECVDTGLIDLTITCGQATGGDSEAITLHSGLLAARNAMGADIAIIAMGPGIAGTATPFGHGGVSQAEAVNAVQALGGDPIATVRMSFADSRQRHIGVSHHFINALATLALAKAMVPIPAGISDDRKQLVMGQLESSGIVSKHDVVEVDVDPERMDTRGLEVKTMGRSFADDPEFFLAAYAAGIQAGKMSVGKGAIG